MTQRFALPVFVTCMVLLAGLAPVRTAPEQPASRTNFKVDAVHSTAIFGVQHLGAGMFYGRFNDVSGTISVDPEGKAAPVFDVAIAIDSVDSGNQSLDGHLKNPDFFDAANHPEMTFKSTSVKRKSDKVWAVTGDFSIRGVTKSITVDMVHHGTANLGRGLRCGFETSFTVKRSEFGVMYGVEMGALGDETRIIVSLEGLEQAADEPPAAEAGDEKGDEEAALPERLAQFDANSDGKLQKDEMPERMQRMFDRLDANGDGSIDGEEARATRRGNRGDG